jgi:hypothetical protein
MTIHTLVTVEPGPACAARAIKEEFHPAQTSKQAPAPRTKSSLREEQIHLQGNFFSVLYKGHD